MVPAEQEKIAATNNAAKIFIHRTSAPGMKFTPAAPQRHGGTNSSAKCGFEKAHCSKHLSGWLRDGLNSS